MLRACSAVLVLLACTEPVALPEELPLCVGPVAVPVPRGAWSEEDNTLLLRFDGHLDCGAGRVDATEVFVGLADEEGHPVPVISGPLRTTASGYETTATFRPSRRGSHTLTARFEPAIGVWRQELEVLARRRVEWTAHAVSGCEDVARSARGTLYCAKTSLPGVRLALFGNRVWSWDAQTLWLHQELADGGLASLGQRALEAPLRAAHAAADQLLAYACSGVACALSLYQGEEALPVAGVVSVHDRGWAVGALAPTADGGVLLGRRTTSGSGEWAVLPWPTSAPQSLALSQDTKKSRAAPVGWSARGLWWRDGEGAAWVGTPGALPSQAQRLLDWTVPEAPLGGVPFVESALEAGERWVNLPLALGDGGLAPQVLALPSDAQLLRATDTELFALERSTGRLWSVVRPQEP